MAGIPAVRRWIGNCLSDGVTSMEWTEIGRVLVMVAHPDDAEFGAAGTVARLTADGKDVFYGIATDGSKGSAEPDMTPDRLTAIRKREQQAAATVLGVKEVCFLDFPDGMLLPTLELRRAITGAIRKYKPDVLICQNPSRDLTASPFAQHPDHLATGEAALAAAYPCARDRLTFPELLSEGLEPHAVKEVWVSGTGTPDIYIDIAATLDQKVAALLAHESQVERGRIETMIPERARQIGSARGLEYAEAFKLLNLS
jgi:LmbE family N-acetylglucosaminyl deacetylase